MSLRRTIISVLVIFALWLVNSTAIHKGEGELFFVSHKDTIDCAIALDHSVRYKGNRNVGFHYELLGAYGEDNGKAIRIAPPAESPECWEMLLDGRLQILAFDATDTIPPQYAGSVLFSTPIKGDDVWVVKNTDHSLINSVNAWFCDFQTGNFFKSMKQRYYRSYTLKWLTEHPDEVTSLSPYDDIIKKYSAHIGLDWRLLSAIIYHESKFSMGVSSGKSAQGLMQLKKSTATKYGVEDLYNPDSNIKAGSMHLDYLLKSFRDEGLDSANVIKFALAAYNAGEANIQVRRENAAERGFNPNDWDEVQKSLKSSQRPTSTYIREVLETYEIYKSLVD